MTDPAPDPNIATVRLLADVNSTDWPDANVQSLLDLQNGAVKLAAADLIEVLAGRLTDVETDEVKLTSAQAKTLMARAAALRTQHYEQEGGDFFFDTATVTSDGCYKHLGPGYTDYQWGYTADEVI